MLNNTIMNDFLKKSANEAQPVLLVELLGAINIHLEFIPFSFLE